MENELSFKVAEKGGVSLYSLHRFPVTFYFEQWVRLLGMRDELLEFLEVHKSELKMKP
jgi:hypothetical protein